MELSICQKTYEAVKVHPTSFHASHWHAVAYIRAFVHWRVSSLLKEWQSYVLQLAAKEKANQCAELMQALELSKATVRSGECKLEEAVSEKKDLLHQNELLIQQAFLPLTIFQFVC
jgi:hypothetical protein